MSALAAFGACLVMLSVGPSSASIAVAAPTVTSQASTVPVPEKLLDPYGRVGADMLMDTAMVIPSVDDTSIPAPQTVVATPYGLLTGIGPDRTNGVWFSDIESGSEPGTASTSYLAHYTPSATGVSRVNLNPVQSDSGQVFGIAPGRNGDEWFTREDGNQLSQLAADGTIHNTVLPTSESAPHDVIVDGKGSVWFTERRGGCVLGRLADGSLNEYLVGGDCYDLALGPDGNVWVAVYGSDEVVEVSASTGDILASYSLSTPTGIASLDGNIWVTEYDTSRLAEITPLGEVTEYQLPTGRDPQWLTAGPDGALWFTEGFGPVQYSPQGNGGIGRFTPGGSLSEITLGPANDGAAGIAATQDAIYFTQQGVDRGLMKIPVNTKQVGEGGQGEGTVKEESGPSGGGSTDNVPVVLVPGLNETTVGVTSPTTVCDLKHAGDFRYLCQALRTARIAVYVVPARVGGGSRILNNEGDLNSNAKILASFIRETIGHQALLVGHSMGGLIARIAISRYKTAAAGLFTIGTPHDGSFAADLGESVATFGCGGSSAVCTLLTIFRRSLPLSAPAVWQMTAPARALERMAPPGVPTWTFAGTAVNPFGGNDGYVFPDDLFVGSSSAWGENADLPSTRLGAALYHGFMGRDLPWDAPGANEFNSSIVINSVVHAAEDLSDFAHRAIFDTSTAASVAQVDRTRKEATVTSTRLSTVPLPLVGVATAKLTDGLDKVPVVRGVVVATREFGIACSGHPMLAPMVVPGIFGIDASALKCTVAMIPKGVTFIATTTPTDLGASARLSRGVTIVTVRSKRQVQSAMIVEGKRKFRLRSAGRRLFEIRLRLPTAARAALSVTVGDHVYRAAIP